MGNPFLFVRLPVLLGAFAFLLGHPAINVIAGDRAANRPAADLPSGQQPGDLKPGIAAPGFSLAGLDGKSVRLTDLKDKPVVLFFGSCTCPIFRHSLGEIHGVCASFKDQVHAYIVYIREAHPQAGLPSNSPRRSPEPTKDERDLAAGDWTAVFGVLGGVLLVLVLYGRNLGRRRFAVASLLVGLVAVACVAACFMTRPADGPIEANPFAGQGPPIEISTQEKRVEVANYFAHEFKVSPPILVDTIDDKVEKQYAATPTRICIIDQEGRIAYWGRPGPGGFQVSEVPPLLDRLLGPAAR
jgi:hypothetical protein